MQEKGEQTEGGDPCEMAIDEKENERSISFSFLSSLSRGSFSNCKLKVVMSHCFGFCRGCMYVRSLKVNTKTVVFAQGYMTDLYPAIAGCFGRLQKLFKYIRSASI